MVNDSEISEEIATIGRKGNAAIEAQFIAQLSPYVQELVLFNQEGPSGGDGATSFAKVRYVKGEDIFDSVKSDLGDACPGIRGASALGYYKNDQKVRAWIYKNREEVIKHVARYLADQLKFGITHADIRPGNIIISKDGRGPPIRIIDYGDDASSPFKEDYVESFIKETKSDYVMSRSMIKRFFSVNDDDKKDLTALLEKEFEDAVAKI